jgi:hypothetical protein
MVYLRIYGVETTSGYAHEHLYLVLQFFTAKRENDIARTSRGPGSGTGILRTVKVSVREGTLGEIFL